MVAVGSVGQPCGSAIAFVSQVTDKSRFQHSQHANNVNVLIYKAARSKQIGAYSVLCFISFT